VSASSVVSQTFVDICNKKIITLCDSYFDHNSRRGAIMISEITVGLHKQMGGNTSSIPCGMRGELTD